MKKPRICEYTISEAFCLDGSSPWYSVERKIDWVGFSRPKETINHGPFKSKAEAEAFVAECKAQDEDFVKQWHENGN